MNVLQFDSEKGASWILTIIIESFIYFIWFCHKFNAIFTFSSNGLFAEVCILSVVKFLLMF